MGKRERKRHPPQIKIIPKMYWKKIVITTNVMCESNSTAK